MNDKKKSNFKRWSAAEDEGEGKKHWVSAQGRGGTEKKRKERHIPRRGKKPKCEENEGQWGGGKKNETDIGTGREGREEGKKKTTNASDEEAKTS